MKRVDMLKPGDFSAWMEENVDELPVPASRIEELLRIRTF